MAGRPAKKNYYTLKTGERSPQLRGTYQKNRYIYANQWNKNHPYRQIKVVNENGKYYFEGL